ncbi:MAG: hypothetical protein IMF26_03300 [Candidatus Fermentithermobacillus carboniphilus]|uniref:Small-conductance mechanosensitive channel n=1 Tax=Candidatus Fermentithermobacillus carboniphilus TaxID=3085328 RepID=A0AAT9LEW0_9FIRM|nr:MAG: hypothetical protein IMF26_03300 [Candidatus Fermentithermobacillus carboniphilus]HHY95797.1 hypothetical protein [Bacillota bacterium]
MSTNTTSKTTKSLTDIDPEIYRKEFSEPIHRVGRATCLMAVAAMFLPSLWLYLQYGVFPPGKAILAGMAAALTYAVPFYIIEPISFYPILGDAGTYMSFLAGNISNMRVPCGAVAQAVAGCEEGSKKGELIATVGIAVSIWVSIFGVLIGALATGWVVKTFSPWLQDAFKTYLLPAVFGAVFGQFALRGMAYAPVALAISVVPILLKWPSYICIPLAVVGMVLVGKLTYRKRPGAEQTPEDLEFH